MRRHLLALTFLVPAAAYAQQAPTVHNFCFPDYDNVIDVDLKRMRDTGVWDDLQASALKLALGQLDREMGFRLDDVDRLLAMVRELPTEDGSSRPGHEELLLFEGNKELPWPKEGREQHVTQIGPATVRAHSETSSSMSVRVGKLALTGRRTGIEPVLRGKPHNGMPCADVMSLQADRRGLLAFCAFHLASETTAATIETRRTMPYEALQAALPGVEWPDDDQPTFVALRLRLQGDEADPRLDLELVLRHAKAGDGLAQTEQAVDAALARVAAMTEMRMFAPLLKKVERTRSGADAIWRVDLGRSRDAAGTVGSVLGMLLVGRPQAAVEAGALPVPRPAPRPVPEGGK